MEFKLQSIHQFVLKVMCLASAALWMVGCSGVNKPLIDPKVATYDSRIIGNWDVSDKGKVDHLTVARCSDRDAPKGLMVMTQGTFDSTKGLPLVGATDAETKKNLTKGFPFVVCAVENSKGRFDYASVLQDYVRIPGQPKPTTAAETQSLVFTYDIQADRVTVRGLDLAFATKLMAQKVLKGEGINPQQSVILDKDSLLAYLSENPPNELFTGSKDNVLVMTRTKSGSDSEALPMIVGPNGKVDYPNTGRMQFVGLGALIALGFALAYFYASKRNRLAKI